MKTKSIFLIGVTFSLFIFAGALSSFTTNEGITKFNSEEETEWENLKVLPNDISRDSLIALMRGYNIALGVKCSYCHSPSKEDPEKLDFVDDEKVEKHIARAMIVLTQEINANYFNHKQDRDPKKITDVSCTMCHRGNPNPKNYLNNMGKLFPQEQEKE